MVISKEYLFETMQKAEIPDQIKILEDQLAESGIEEFSDVLASLLMPILLDLEGGAYPADLVTRVNKLAEQVKIYNMGRFVAG